MVPHFSSVSFRDLAASRARAHRSNVWSGTITPNNHNSGKMSSPVQSNLYMCTTQNDDRSIEILFPYELVL